MSKKTEMRQSLDDTSQPKFMRKSVLEVLACIFLSMGWERKWISGFGKGERERENVPEKVR